jgi:radical SAM superfamily enzyme YgiQ (UPF0313 family)
MTTVTIQKISEEKINQPLPRDFSKKFAEKVIATCHTKINKILLINPPGMSELDFDSTLAFSKRYWCYPPYGIAILCERLKQSGFECDILDLNFSFLKSVISESDDLGYEEKILGFIKDKVESFRPDIVGISVMFTMSDEPMQFLISQFSSRKLPVIVGGVHPTNDPDDVLYKNPELLCLGRFESDNTLPQLLKSINQFKKNEADTYYEAFDMVKNTSFLHQDEVFEFPLELSPSLMSFGVPDYCGLPVEEYSKYGQVGTYHFLRPESRAAGSILAKRGCRAQCTFCSVRSFNGTGVRSREVEKVVTELKELYNKGIRHFTWLDDDLLYNGKGSLEMFSTIADLNLDVTWDASNGLIAGAITKELLEAMVNSGCVGFNLGIESGSDRILRSVKKPGNCKTFKKAARLIEEFPSLFVKGFLMMAFPDETLSEMKETIDLANDLAHDWYPIQILNPLPSTKIISSVAEAGQLGSDTLEEKQKDGTNFTAGVFSSLRLKRQQAKADKLKVIGSEGDSIAHEKNKKNNGSEITFIDYFSKEHYQNDLVPEQSQYADIWFAMDYYINYEPIFRIENKESLRKKELILEDITNRITRSNPLGLFFLAEVQEKLGKIQEAKNNKILVKDLRRNSEFWDVRMNAFCL